MGNLNLFSFAGVSNSAIDLLFIILFLLFSVAIILVAVFLITKFIYVPKESNAKNNLKTETAGDTANKPKKDAFNYALILAAILGIGLILRLIFTFIIKGYREDFNIIFGYFEALSGGGISSYYKANGIILYPAVAYIYGIFGGMSNALGVTTSSVSLQFFIKFPLILADLGSACVIYIVAKKYINKMTALVLSGLISLFPAFIFASSVWGSIFSLYMLIILLCFYFVSTKNFPALISVYSLALLSSKDAVYLFPVMAVFVIYNYVKYCMALKGSGPKSFNSMMRDKEQRNVILIPVYVILSLVLMYLVSLPLMINVSSNFFTFINRMFFKPLGTLGYFGMNSLNIFNLFGKNGTKIVANFPSVIFAVLFAVIITALVLLVYLSRKNRANLSYLGAFIILTLSIFYMDFSALNLTYVLGLLLLAFILIKDKRILHIFSLLSVSVLLNASTVMAKAGYLNNIEDYLLDSSTNSEYTGSIILNSGGGMAVSIICSVITIVTFAYATIILLDISMSNKRKLFKPNETKTFFNSIKNFIK